jgi:hypothetical protein
MRKRVNACIAECSEHFLFFVFWYQSNLFFNK